MPSSFSNVRRGEAVKRAQSPQAEPVRLSWKNMLMIALMARQPFAISAVSFLIFSAGSEEVNLKLKSLLEDAVPGDWFCEVPPRAM
jgi:hypothetical protein